MHGPRDVYGLWCRSRDAFQLKMLLLALLYFNLVGAFPTTLEPVSPGQAMCPGETVSFICSVGGAVVTWHTPRGEFSHSLYGSHHEGVERQFNWSIETTQQSSNILRSTLTFAADNIEIGCRNETESSSDAVQLQVDVKGPPSAPEQFLTGINSIHRINATFSTVDLVWTRPESYSDISQYVITVDPPTLLPSMGIIKSSDQCFEDKRIAVALEHEQKYTFRVRADNCNNQQQGTPSTALSIHLQVPHQVKSCSITPVYIYSSNHLINVDIQWQRVLDPSEPIAPGITSDIDSYLVSLVPTSEGSPTNYTVTDLTLCQDKCAYSFSGGDTSLLSYSVHVSAGNILGLGVAKSCSNHTISAVNDLVAVEVHHCDEHIEISCRSLTRFMGLTHCEIAYGTDSTREYLPFFASSEKMDLHTDLITVRLVQTLEINTTYYFNLTTKVESMTVRVLGNFETGLQVPNSQSVHCSASDLGSVLEGPPQCRLNEIAAVISNGVVCYTGTATGSLAYYLCDHGYELEAVDRKESITDQYRMCQDDHQWSLPDIKCIVHLSNEMRPNESAKMTKESEKHILESCSTSLGISGAICILILLPTGLFIGVAAMYVYKKTSERRKPTEAINPFYDYVGVREAQKPTISTECNPSYSQSLRERPLLPERRKAISTDVL